MLSSLGSFAYLTVRLRDADSDGGSPLALPADRAGQVEARHADVNAALMTVLLWGTQQAVAQAGVIQITVNESLMPVLLNGGTRKQWEDAIEVLATRQRVFVDTIRNERFRLW